MNVNLQEVFLIIELNSFFFVCVSVGGRMGQGCDVVFPFVFNFLLTFQRSY